jgi:hypothetical protein
MFGQSKSRRIGAISTHVAIVVVAGLTLMAIAFGLTLAGSPIVVVGKNSVEHYEEIGPIRGPSTVCQDGEVLPRGTSAIQFALYAIYGPRLKVTASSNGRILTKGERGSGWIGETVTVPVNHITRNVSGVKICATLGHTDEDIGVSGDKTPTAAVATNGTRKLAGRMKIEYLHSGRQSWWSLASWVAGHMGVLRAPSGIAVALLVLVGIVGIVMITVWLTIKELR